MHALQDPATKDIITFSTLAKGLMAVCNAHGNLYSNGLCALGYHYDTEEAHDLWRDFVKRGWKPCSAKGVRPEMRTL